MDSQEKYIIRPLPKRVLDIRNEECPHMNLYKQKYISAENETSLAKDLLTHNMYEPVTIMITRAIFYTYMGLRSIFSFVVFFRSLYCTLTTPLGRSTLKTWFLEALQQREHLHCGRSIVDKERQDCLLALINGILNERLVDKADCVIYFSSPTLEALNIIPCATRFERRCERLDFAPMNQQNKTAVSLVYNTKLVNKVTHHYILNTLEIDNAKHGYAIIPLSQIGKFSKLFRSYLVGDDKLDATMIVDVMIDLFMDEVQHNYLFWVGMIKKNTDLSRLPNPDNNQVTCSSSDKTAPDHTNKSILADLFLLKLKHASNSSTSIQWPVYFATALTIKDDLLEIDNLLPQHQQQDDTWVTLLAMAMFSIGDDTRALQVLEKAQVSVSGPLCDWLQQLIVAHITSWLNDQLTSKSTKETSTESTTTTATKKKSKAERNKNRRPSPLSQVSLPYEEDDLDLYTDDEDFVLDDYDSQYVGHCMISPARTEESFDSTTTAVNTIADDNTIHHDDDENDNDSTPFDYLSPQFFYNQKNKNTLLTALQLLNDFIVPCMTLIGGTQMAESPNTMNNIMIIIYHALQFSHSTQTRKYLAELFTTYIFPVLSFTLLDDVHECLQLLTPDERLDAYLCWLDGDCDGTLRDCRNQAKDDVDHFLNTITSTSTATFYSTPSISQYINDNNALSSLAQHHPLDVADMILDRIEATPIDDHNKSTLVMAAAANLIRGDQGLLRDGLFALLSHRLLTSDDIIKSTCGNLSLMPGPVASLCRFSNYLFNERRFPSIALLPYLSGSSLVKSGFILSRVIGDGPALTSNALERPLSKKRNASALGTSQVPNKRSL